MDKFYIIDLLTVLFGVYQFIAMTQIYKAHYESELKTEIKKYS